LARRRGSARCVGSTGRKEVAYLPVALTQHSAFLCLLLAAPVAQEPTRTLDGTRVVEAAPPPSIVTDEDVRERIAATGLPWLVEDVATGIELVLVPPGRYWRGAADDDEHAAADERPRHEVVVREPLYFGRTEVTQAQWRRVMKAGPSFFDGDELPVEQVDRFDVAEFLGRTGFELPTEAEWEYACRAGGGPARALDDVAWHRGNAGGRTHPVGAKAPNGFGLHDMLGNVWEWTASPYLKDEYRRYDEPHDAAVVRARGSQVSLRGGSWYDGARRVRPTARYFGAWSFAAGHVGFRVIRRVDTTADDDERRDQGEDDEPPR